MRGKVMRMSEDGKESGHRQAVQLARLICVCARAFVSECGQPECVCVCVYVSVCICGHGALQSE